MSLHWCTTGVLTLRLTKPVEEDAFSELRPNHVLGNSSPEVMHRGAADGIIEAEDYAA
jgi:hypothetical protein